MYWDLNCVYDEKTAAKVAETAIKLGYDGIAFNHTTNRRLTNKDACKIKLPQIKPELVQQLSHRSSLRFETKHGAFRQLKRLTVVLEETAQIQSLNISNPVLKTYDLIAVKPTDEKLFHLACHQLEVDIICLDMSQKLPFYIKRPSVNRALERGIYFEIQYGDAIRDSKLFRHLVHNIQALTHFTRGKQILFSSESKRPLDMRSPYDVINLAVLLGLTQPQALSAVSSHCTSAVIHAETRQTMKGVFQVEYAKDMHPSESWKYVSSGSEVESNKRAAPEDEGKEAKRRKTKGGKSKSSKPAQEENSDDEAEQKYADELDQVETADIEESKDEGE
eukprot:TRINITY_DN4772_c0_g2_i2.p1 TRINITY_DN4772_c0_g2~~TRINITY_DN4772_c0_g2_i2.p1  ORF type:complete len:334 (+),score=50.82 TRINITY_DN4772_c0_g2_i2:71-1072(+)